MVSRNLDKEDKEKKSKSKSKKELPTIESKRKRSSKRAQKEPSDSDMVPPTPPPAKRKLKSKRNNDSASDSDSHTSSSSDDYSPPSIASQQMKFLEVKYENIATIDDSVLDINTEVSNNEVKELKCTVGLTKEDVDDKYGDVFKGLGHMPGKVHPETDPSVTPVVIPLHPIPVATKSKLKQELACLEKLHVIEKSLVDLVMAQSYKIPPKLTEEITYQTWKNEVRIYSMVTDLADTKQAPAIALLLTGEARETAIEIDVEDLHKKDGLDILFKQLYLVLKKNSVNSTYEAYTNFEKFAQKETMSMSAYIMEFKLLYNKSRKHDTGLQTAG
ncbi:hypothetical protein HOLleu_28747 [Holothuria leucospilota]|uniref:Uncharacterized protein n=1 Tax=Holothuria leucospilota TaxID=206669 RepID=A0A9Q1H0R2_HOLLE|nr:hypothetical protein HOLleu_28747 [Holothuria leucospilota]